MPRAGLDPAVVTAAGAALADEVGFAQLTMGLVAERLGVRTPSLYKHVTNLEDLNRRIAVLAATEAGDVIGRAVQGLAGRDALAAAAHAYRQFILTHRGRYQATIGVTRSGSDDALMSAEARSMDAFTAVLRSYGIAPDDMVHALRGMRSFFHGFASLQASNGFQWAPDVDESFEWLIDLFDQGLRRQGARPAAGDPGTLTSGPVS